MNKLNKISDLQDKHKGEIIFIVGSGPSINNINVELLKNYTVMAVNSGIIAAPFAKYFVSDDPDIMNWSYFSDIKKSECICLLYEDRFKNKSNFLPENRTFFYKHKMWFSPPSTYNLPDGLIMTKDITKPIIGSRTSTGSCVHLAFCLGAKIIVLLGNDCTLSKDKNHYRYFWQNFPKEKQPYRIRGSQFNKNTQNFGFDQKAFVEYWNKFVEANKNILENEMIIIDSSNSILSCFPKMSIDSILEKYGNRKRSDLNDRSA